MRHNIDTVLLTNLRDTQTFGDTAMARGIELNIVDATSVNKITDGEARQLTFAMSLIDRNISS